MGLFGKQRDYFEKFWVFVLNFHEVIQRKSAILDEIQVVHGPNSLPEIGIYLKQLFHQMVRANDFIISVPRNFAITFPIFTQIKEFQDPLKIIGSTHNFMLQNLSVKETVIVRFELTSQN